MKKILAILVCLTMALGICMPALAIDLGTTETKSETVFYGYRKYEAGLASGTIGAWISFTVDTIDDPTVVSADESNGLEWDVNSGVYYNGLIYAFTNHRDERVIVDPATWEREVSENEAFYSYYDMTLDPITGIAYGIHTGDTLYSIDVLSGLGTPVAPFGGDIDVYNNDPEMERDMWTLACDDEGTLYGIDQKGDLFSIDKTTAEGTLIGNTGVDTVGYRQSMTYDAANGIMYWAMTNDDVGEFYSVNLETGEATRYGTLGNNIELACLLILDDVPTPPPTSPGTPTPTPTPTPTATPAPTPSDFILYEDFEDGTDEWSFVDADGDGFNWANNIIAAGEGGLIEAYEGENCICSNSYDNASAAALTPDNWMISPAFTAAADCDLSWYVAAQDPDWAAENYSVYVGSADATSPADFTEVVYNGVSTAAWVQKVVALDEYAGQSIRIAFRHHDISDMYMIKLDLITVTGTGSVEPTPTSEQPTPTPEQPTPTPEEPTPTPEEPTMFTVTFVDWDDTVIAEVEVAEGEDAVAPTNPERENYVFTGWDGDFTNVTADLTVKATYRAMGDANGDGLVNTGDAVTVLKYCVDDITFDELQKLVADFNKDGNVNTGDAVSILIYCVEA